MVCGCQGVFFLMGWSRCVDEHWGLWFCRYDVRFISASFGISMKLMRMDVRINYIGLFVLMRESRLNFLARLVYVAYSPYQHGK